MPSLKPVFFFFFLLDSLCIASRCPSLMSPSVPEKEYSCGCKELPGKHSNFCSHSVLSGHADG